MSDIRLALTCASKIGRLFLPPAACLLWTHWRRWGLDDRINGPFGNLSVTSIVGAGRGVRLLFRVKQSELCSCAFTTWRSKLLLCIPTVWSELIFPNISNIQVASQCTLKKSLGVPHSLSRRLEEEICCPCWEVNRDSLDVQRVAQLLHRLRFRGPGVCEGMRIRKFLVVQFFPASCYFLT